MAKKKKKQDKGSSLNIGDVYGDLSGNFAGRDINQETINAGAGSVIDSEAGGHIITGDNVNIGSTLTNVTQQVGGMAQATSNEQAKLEALLKQLEEALNALPAEKQEEAEIVVEYAGELVEEASGEKPRQRKLQITGEGLKQAAEDLRDVAPMIGEIAGKIVMRILALGG